MLRGTLTLTEHGYRLIFGNGGWERVDDDDVGPVQAALASQE